MTRDEAPASKQKAIETLQKEYDKLSKAKPKTIIEGMQQLFSMASLINQMRLVQSQPRQPENFNPISFMKYKQRTYGSPASTDPVLLIKIKRSKRTGQLYWVMYGANGEKMAHSETIKNRTYLNKLMERFEKMGFKVER